MPNNEKNVAAGKPKIGGAIFAAPVGTTLPADASTALGQDFACLGYVDEDGLKNALDRSSEEIKAWGGDTVMVLNEETSDGFRFVLIECLNPEVLKLVYGTDNVTVTAAGDNTPEKIAIDVVDQPVADEHVIVIDTLLRDAIKRIILPRAAVSEVGEVAYEDSDVVGYDTTLKCMPVVLGGKKVYHRELIEK